jgi:prevent-host-death family protein
LFPSIPQGRGMDGAPGGGLKCWDNGHIIVVILEGEGVMKTMAAAQFKAQCLTVMDHVSQSGSAIVITKHGKPVVKVVPIDEDEDAIFGALAGVARVTGDIETTVAAKDWGVK